LPHAGVLSIARDFAVGTAAVTDDPEAIAERERKKFGVTLAELSPWPKRKTMLSSQM